MKRCLILLVAAMTVFGSALGVSAHAAVSPLDLVNPVSDYKVYVSENCEELVKRVRKFTDAIKEGDVATARELYAPSRVPFEKIEPIAELFSDLDSSIDSRADDHEKAEKDPAFIGFHRIEYGLFEKNSTDGLAPIADRLMADVIDLQGRVEGLTFPPEKVVGGAAALMEEVAATKVSGEEDRYSHTDLWDFQANVDGAKKIVELFRPLIEAEHGPFVTKVDANFSKVDGILSRYRAQEGFVTYDDVGSRDRNAMIGPVNALAEDLSMLRGLLGLN